MFTDVAPGLLAIDTSTETAGIALSHSGGVAAHTWPAARAQTTTVLPEIDRMIREIGQSPSFITGVVVATGPGTFTGLRVGLSIAKGIVAASGVPLVGVPTLDTVLAAHDTEDMIAMLPAGRGRVVWQQRGEQPRNSTVEELIAQLAERPDTLLCGEVQDTQQEAIATAHANVLWEPRNPEVLLRLGAARIARGDVDDPVTLEPTYLHGAVPGAGPVTDKRPRQ